MSTRHPSSRRRNPHFFALLSTLLLVPTAQCFTSDPKVVDLSIALKFDGYTVSQYIVDKNYNFFLATAKYPPSPEEITDWFTRFIAEQALIAELRQQEWHDRPQVAKPVESMERYMLIQDNGPLLSVLVPLIPEPPESIESIRERARTIVTGSFISLPSGQSQPVITSEKRQHFGNLLVATNIDSSLRNVTLHWPYHPFMSIRNDIAEAEVGHLHGPFLEQGRFLYFQLDGKDNSNTYYEDKPDHFIADYATQVDRSVRLARYKFTLEKQAQLEIEEERNLQLFKQVIIDAEGRIRIDDDKLGNSMLFKFDLNGNRKSITVAQFIDDYNQSIQRQPLDQPNAIEREIKRFVLSRQCQLIGLSQGITKSPRFAQNRLNYENNCILETYKAIIINRLKGLSDDEIKQSFDQFYSDVTKPARVEGNLLVYDSWKSVENGDSPIVISRVEISETSPSIFEAWPNQILLTLADGTRIGPTSLDQGVGIFEKIRTLELRAVSIAEIRIELERRIFDKRFHTQILGDFERRVRALDVRCYIDFSKYNIRNPIGQFCSN